MEGDAGARQLNPIGVQDSRDQGEREADDAADVSSAETADTSDAVEVTEESSRSAAGDDVDDTDDLGAPDDAVDPEHTSRPSRLGRGWFAGICAALVLVAAAAGVGGYLALRFHDETSAVNRADEAAVAAAKDCVAATQAPDTAAITAGQGKIIDCATGAFGAQAALYSGVLVDAYRAAQVTVSVSDIRAAVEGHNPDGSVDVLVAVRVKVTNSDAADQEQGYRLRVQMLEDQGKYRISKMEQVTSS